MCIYFLKAIQSSRGFSWLVGWFVVSLTLEWQRVVWTHREGINTEKPRQDHESI